MNNYRHDGNPQFLGEEITKRCKPCFEIWKEHHENGETWGHADNLFGMCSSCRRLIEPKRWIEKRKPCKICGGWCEHNAKSGERRHLVKGQNSTTNIQQVETVEWTDFMRIIQDSRKFAKTIMNPVFDSEELKEMERYR